MHYQALGCCCSLYKPIQPSCINAFPRFLLGPFIHFTDRQGHAMCQLHRVTLCHTTKDQLAGGLVQVGIGVYKHLSFPT
jgi:hypothetical protein